MLALGSRGSAVSNLQKNLNTIGKYGLVVDGVFGQKTRSAVIDFQTNAGITVDGEVGPQTQTAITKALVTHATTPRPESDEKFRNEVVDKFLAKVQYYIKLPVRETDGKNRSKIIDGWNKRVGVYLGAPYCASSIWCIWDEVCKENGWIFPMSKTASSQAFVTKVPSKYVRKDGALGRRGDAGVLQVPTDKAHGHMTVLREDQVRQPYFETSEFNTNMKGSRDGEGGYDLRRSTVDYSIENNLKLFRNFVDIPQWVVDANKKK